MDHRDDVPRRAGVTRWIAAILGLVTLGVGAWAFASPQTFFERIAVFPPYNEHLLHDIGAFEIGLGAVLVLAALVRDSLVVALAGVGAGMAVHAISHAIDARLGGSPGDPWIGWAFAALLFVAAGLRAKALRR